MVKSRGSIVGDLEVVSANAAAAKIPTPFGLPRVVLIIGYSIAICLTGMAVGAADPLMQMLLRNGALDHLEVHEERKSLLASIVGVGVSFTLLSGIVIGPLVDIVGSKLVAVLGILLHMAGYIFFFFIGSQLWLLYLGAVAFGTAFQCLVCAHLSAGCLFPTQANLIIGIIGAAPDMSYLVPASLLAYANYLDSPDGVQTAVWRYLLVACVPALILTALLVPWRPFQIPSSSAKNDARGFVTSASDVEQQRDDAAPLAVTEQTALVPGAIRRKVPREDDEVERQMSLTNAPQRQSAVASQVLQLSLLNKPGGRDSLRRKEDGTFSGGPFWHLPVWSQLRTADYWLFLPIFGYSFLRRKHYMFFLRETLAEMAITDLDKIQAANVMTMFNFLVPYGFIAAIVWGWLVDICGLTGIVFASLIFGTFNSSLLIVSSPLALHFGTVVLKIVHQSFVLGLCMAFCVTYYGLNTISTMQGVATFIIGILSLMQDAWWPSFVQKTLDSFSQANIIILWVGIAVLLLPVLLVMRQSRRAAGRA